MMLSGLKSFFKKLLKTPWHAGPESSIIFLACPEQWIRERNFQRGCLQFLIVEPPLFYCADFLVYGEAEPWQLNSVRAYILFKCGPGLNFLSSVKNWAFVFSINISFGEFDPGSGRTLAACLKHASRTVKSSLLLGSVAYGWVTREQPADKFGIPIGNDG